MKPQLRASLALSVSALGAASIVAEPRADACGGFFCNTVPVVQSGEKIIFSVDQQAGTVDAIIQINYQGAAQDFAWVLPLQSAPDKIGVGTGRLFATVDNLTAPRFFATYDFSGQCSFFPGGGGFSDAGAQASADGGTSGGVDVLQRALVGPYDSAVIQGSDPEEIRTWLTDNGYRVTDQMMEAIVPYVAQGDVLLALKLRNDTTTGDLQPIALTMHATEACIPLRLTAIAAQDDMSVTAVVLSNAGRAIPKNYFHVTPNLARINWVRNGNNYRSLIGDAADEAGGNAFTTEFAGSSRIFANRIYAENEYHLNDIQAATNLAEFIDQILLQGLNARAELRAILQRNITDAQIRSGGVDPMSFWSCPNCFLNQLTQVPYDPTAAVGEIRERIVEADRYAQQLFDQHSYVTRLYTEISPAEMTLDPLFEFRSNLPDVSNVHQAAIHVECDSSGRLIGDHMKVTLDSGEEFYVDQNGNIELGAIGNLPASAKIEQLSTGQVITDNTGMVPGPGPGGLIDSRAPSSSCSCGVAGTAETLAGTLVFMAFLAGLALRRTRS